MTKAPASGNGENKRTCPVCGQAVAAAHHPFCSVRCREVDLGRWLKGVYVIPGRPGEEDE